MKTEKMLLAGAGRGTDEEPGLALPDHDEGLGLGRGGAQLHHHNDGRCGRHWRQCVHHDAQLAMIGVGLVGVKVRYLGHGKERQQDKTHHGDHRQEASPGTVSAVEVRLKGCQPWSLTVLIVQKNVSSWTLSH
jgi:hypothetical protein